MEKSASWPLKLDDGSIFMLTAKADRIEVGLDGMASVFDYKTGRTPTIKQVQAGFAPQITLEAAMIEAGAFEDIGAHRVIGGAYVGLKNGGKPQPLKFDNATFEEVVGLHRLELLKMLSQFREPRTPYPSRPFVALVAHEGAYDHLARVKEWSRGGGEGA